MQEIQVSSKEKFACMILDMARDEGLDVIEAIVAYCERNEINIEDAISMLDRNMKEQIRVDAIRGRYVRGQKLTELDL